jgi:hypothetical protein
MDYFMQVNRQGADKWNSMTEEVRVLWKEWLPTCPIFLFLMVSFWFRCCLALF